MPGSIHHTPPPLKVHKHELRFCSHCQKNQPSKLFYGVNRNKGSKGYQYLKTCEPCRNKPSQKRQSQVSSSNIINTRRVRSSSTPGQAARDRTEDREGSTTSAQRRNPRRHANHSNSPDYVTPQEDIPPPAHSPQQRSPSTQDEIGVASSFNVRPLKRGHEIPEPSSAKRSRALDARPVNGHDHVSELPQPRPPPPPQELSATVPREISETPYPELPQPEQEDEAADDDKELMKLQIEEEAAALEEQEVVEDDRQQIGDGLRQFAGELSRLSDLLMMAVNDLDTEAIEGLEEEINHDWKVVEMSTFVDGYIRGAKRRMARVARP